jgi:endonuclease/exonuclease/phosphatase family metal-dependent hydrolase
MELCGFATTSHQVDGKDVVVFDFDGVVHTCVRPPTGNGQVHPTVFNAKSLVRRDCLNHDIRDKIRQYRRDGALVYIVSNNAKLNVEGIVTTLDAWDIVVDGVEIVAESKVAALKRLRASVFYDDSRNKIDDIVGKIPSRLAVHYQPPVSDGLTILSYNVSWESMKPTKSGFGSLGKACRENVNECRTNVEKLIRVADADIVALQETPKEFLPCIKAAFDREYHIDILNDSTLGVECQVTMHRRGLGLTVDYTQHGSFRHKTRPFTVIHFKEGLAMVNLHAGHAHGPNEFRVLKDFLEENEEVILAGDFNRYLAHLHIGSHQIVNGASRTIHTCCSTKKKQRPSHHYDHIMSTLDFLQPTRRLITAYPASDHLPVIAAVGW